jgi:hypothetical protein
LTKGDPFDRKKVIGVNIPQKVMRSSDFRGLSSPAVRLIIDLFAAMEKLDCHSMKFIIQLYDASLFLSLSFSSVYRINRSQLDE